MKDFFLEIWNDFSKAFIVQDRWKLYLEGLGNTLIIALMAAVIGITIGVVLAMINYINKKTGKLRTATKISNVYITVVRGTPVVLQLMILYFVVFSFWDNWQTMRAIIIPQAVRNCLPPLFNEFIMLVKETAIVGYVGIYDLGKIPGLIQSRTFDYLFPLLIAAVLYLIVVLGLTKILHVLENHMAKSDRNRGGATSGK